MLFIGGIGVVVYFLQTFFKDDLENLGFSFEKHKIQVDEDLPNFFQAVKLSFADELVMTAQHMRDKYSIEIECPDVVNRLDET